MKTGVKVFLNVVLALVVIVSGFVSYVLWDNRDIPIARPPVVAEEVLAPFELKREVYGDPEIFDQPRIQFSWQGPNREKPEIWSVKVDGSDLRLAVDADLLYPKDIDVGIHPGFNTYRSPDNRHILVLMGKRRVSYFAVYIIDLKEQKNTRIEDSEHAFLIRYPWVSDSKSFFYLRDKTRSLSRYYLDGGKNEIIKQTFSNSFYVQQTEEIINQIGSKDLIRLDFKGNELERIPLGENLHQSTHYVNPSGNYFIYQNYEGIYLAPINNMKKIENLPTMLNPMINMLGNKIFNGLLVDAYYYEIEKKEKIFFFSKYGGEQLNKETGYQIHGWSLFNERINNVK